MLVSNIINKISNNDYKNKRNLYKKILIKDVLKLLNRNHKYTYLNTLHIKINQYYESKINQNHSNITIFITKIIFFFANSILLHFNIFLQIDSINPTNDQCISKYNICLSKTNNTGKGQIKSSMLDKLRDLYCNCLKK